MKKLIIILLFLFLPGISLAAFSLPDWKYFKEVESPAVGLMRLTLDDQILANTEKSLADLRVVENGSREIPFKLVVGREEQKTVKYSPLLLDNSYQAGAFTSVVLDLGGSGKITNSVTIKTSSENFQRNVVISGSNDRNVWNVLKNDGYVYDFTDNKASAKFQDTSVSFPDSTFRYLKVEISDDGSGPVKVISAVLSQETKSQSREVERNPQFSVEEIAGDKTSEVILDLGAKGIPTSKVKFQTAGENFSREVLIFGSQDKADWKYVSSGFIFRYRTPKFSGENLTLNFPETENRYLKLKVKNKDDESLKISGMSVFSVYRDVLFNVESGNSYRIYYGNAEAKFPEYDLERYFQYLDADNASASALSVQKDNAQFVPRQEAPKPLSERSPFFLPLVLIFSSLVLLFLVYRFFQDVKKEDK